MPISEAAKLINQLWPNVSEQSAQNAIDEELHGLTAEDRIIKYKDILYHLQRVRDLD